MDAFGIQLADGRPAAGYRKYGAQSTSCKVMPFNHRGLQFESQICLCQSVFSMGIRDGAQSQVHLCEWIIATGCNQLWPTMNGGICEKWMPDWIAFLFPVSILCVAAVAFHRGPTWSPTSRGPCLWISARFSPWALYGLYIPRVSAWANNVLKPDGKGKSVEQTWLLGIPGILGIPLPLLFVSISLWWHVRGVVFRPGEVGGLNWSGNANMQVNSRMLPRGEVTRWRLGVQQVKATGKASLNRK